MTDIRAGQRYRARIDFATNALTHWRAPFTGGNEVTFPAGEVFEIVGDPPAGATAAYCKPERYDELHSRFIPKDDRDAEKYDGYSLVIDFGVIRENAELLDE